MGYKNQVLQLFYKNAIYMYFLTTKQLLEAENITNLASHNITVIGQNKFVTDSYVIAGKIMDDILETIEISNFHETLDIKRFTIKWKIKIVIQLFKKRVHLSNCRTSCMFSVYRCYP